MKRVALVTGILAMALLLAGGLAFAQEVKYEIIKGEPGDEATKEIEVYRVVTPDAGGMSFGPGMMRGMMGDACCEWHGMSGGMMCGPGGAMSCGPGGAMSCGPGGTMSCGPGGAKMIKARVLGGPGMGGGMGCCGDGGGMMGGACGKLQKLGCICQYEKCAEMLELSKKQVASLKEIRMSSKKAAIRAMADVKIANLELDEILKGCCPDLVKVKAKISEIAQLKEDMCLAKVTALQKAQKVLTKEQLDKFESCRMGTCSKTAQSCMKTCVKKEQKACDKKVMIKKKAEMKEKMEQMEQMKEEMKEE